MNVQCTLVDNIPSMCSNIWFVPSSWSQPIVLIPVIQFSHQNCAFHFRGYLKIKKSKRSCYWNRHVFAVWVSILNIRMCRYFINCEWLDILKLEVFERCTIMVFRLKGQDTSYMSWIILWVRAPASWTSCHVLLPKNASHLCQKGISWTLMVPKA